MDPVTFALGIAGVLPLVAAAIRFARSYRDAIRNRSKSIATLIVELEALEACLKSLGEFLNSDALKTGDVKFDDTSVLRSCCSVCETKLGNLCKKLGQEENGNASRYLWPLSEKEHEKTVQELRNFTIWMQFALSVDGCRLLSRTREDVLQIMGQQLEQFKTIQSIQLQTLKLSDVIEAQTRLIEQSNQQEAKRKLLNWISTMKHDQKHSRIRGSRTENTGSWLLQTAEYLVWRDDLSAANLLWCPGIQGSGKTTLV
jgi:hypothetical protein